jgi:hypothetical protein
MMRRDHKKRSSLQRDALCKYFHCRMRANKSEKEREIVDRDRGPPLISHFRSRRFSTQVRNEQLLRRYCRSDSHGIISPGAKGVFDFSSALQSNRDASLNRRNMEFEFCHQIG